MMMKKILNNCLYWGLGVLTISSPVQAFSFTNKDEKLCEETYLSGEFELAQVSCLKAVSKSAKAQYYLGSIYLQSGRKNEGVALLEAASNEQPQAALALGEHYENLKDADEGDIKALFYYDFACDRGLVKACERVHLIRTKQQQLAEEKKKKEAEQQERSEAERKLREREAQLAKERKEHEEQMARERELLERQKRENEEERTALEQRRQNMSQSNSTSTQPSTNLDFNTVANYGTGVTAIGELTKFQHGALWGYIDSYNNWIVRPSFRYAAGFYEGLAAVQLPSGSWGFINRQGQLVIAAEFCAVARFSDGLAGVNVGGNIAADGTCEGGAWGYINKTGRFQIPPVFEWVGRYNHGVADVKYKGTSLKLNKSGDVLN